MHFIEQLFGFSLDAGSGLAEAIVLGGLAAFCVASSIFLRSRSLITHRLAGNTVLSLTVVRSCLLTSLRSNAYVVIWECLSPDIAFEARVATVGAA